MKQNQAPTVNVAVGQASFDPELGLDDPKASEISGEFVGKWNHLVSTTNWEKGKIICQWREALLGSESAPSSYSDEAWSSRVGGVSGQHVGRLRRVFERFGQSYTSYAGLFWSHFLTALDWDDADMWLEGALQSQWSVSQMRQMRWEAQGADPSDQPQDNDFRSQSDDEDFVALNEVGSAADARDVPYDTTQAGPRYDDPDFGDEDSESAGPRASSPDDDELAPWEDRPSEAINLESPFSGLPELPSDFADALEQFKLAIIRHRSDGWTEVPRESIIQTLEALKVFTLQPSSAST